MLQTTGKFLNKKRYRHRNCIDIDAVVVAFIEKEDSYRLWIEWKSQHSGWSFGYDTITVLKKDADNWVEVT